jgi:hypothetical protein
MPTFSGIAEPGYTVEVTVHSDPVTCNDTANTSGEWSCALPSTLPAGNHTVIVTVTDLFGAVYTLGPTSIVVADDAQPSGGGGSSPSASDENNTNHASSQAQSKTGARTESYTAEDANNTASPDSATSDDIVADNGHTNPVDGTTQALSGALTPNSSNNASSRWVRYVGIAVAITILVSGAVFVVRRFLHRV